MSIDIRVYDPELTLKGIIDEFSSLIWIRRYQAAGEFELHTPYSEEARSLLVAGNIVQKHDGRSVLEAGVIEYIQMSHEEIIVKGRFIESYLENRLIKFHVYYGNAEDSMREIISEILESEARAIPLLELGTDRGLTETLEFQATLKTVLNVFSRVCRATSLGFRIRPDFTARKLYFEVYKGADRASDTASKVIFSETYDNIFNEVYIYDNTNYKSTAYVSQLIDDHRWLVFYNTQLTGLERREVYIPASVETEDKSFEEIYAEMQRAGKDALDKYTVAESLTFSTDVDATFKYREDYDLGDLVIINHNAWDIYQTRRITEIEEDYEGSNMNIILTCGDPLPETIDFKEGY